MSKDLPATQKKFEAKFQLPFRLLSDAGLEVQKAWGVWGKKNMYGKMVEGTIRTTLKRVQRGAKSVDLDRATSA